MRTTVEMSDDLIKRAKRFALDHGMTLKEVLIEGLERVLAPSEVLKKSRLQVAPIRLSEGSPLRRLAPEQISQIDSEDETAHLNEIYRRR